MNSVLPVDGRGVVTEHTQVADDFRHLRIKATLPSGAAAPICQAVPGQFVQLLPAVATSSPLLRIPLSISAVDPQTSTFDVLYEITGPKSLALSHLSPGDGIDCLGPLGKPFPLADADRRTLLVGGGIGVPPLLHLGHCLRQQGGAPILIAGARHRGKHLPPSMLGAASQDVRQATDDGSLGHHGYVTDLLQAELQLPGEAVVYTCGPHAMMAAVAAACVVRGVPCYASLEEYMACGFGVCVGCVVERATPGASPYDRFTRVCVDGPVYDAIDIVW